MSRRHSSSRRRNYGRRQHEVRERREPRAGDPLDWSGRAATDDWRGTDIDDERHTNGAPDSRGGNVR